MTLTRRRFFGFGSVLASLAAVPVAEQVAKADDVQGPIVLEHTCDHGRSRYTEEQIREWQKEAPWRFEGCGTTFRWHWGTPAICPNCGWNYLVQLEDLKNGFYKRVSG